MQLPIEETQETWVQSLGGDCLLEEEMTAHWGTLAWKVPWREEPGGLPSMGSQRVRHDIQLNRQVCLVI